MTSEDFKHLPVVINAEDMIAEVETRPVPDPDGGLNPETVFMLRNAGV